ncbi:hypothetical protein PTTG_03675 [Puccinia triticina 1-1 BBBD Race 1]|uniref:Uncharacterized protein n=1 Tax=Puccinia triticina (isolate 1-1 / race 1 (BBBD)) TaxID=630390 RepID=A0A0C4ESA1_PUCT1|nr:hypothetical protein PTTG_03675 [Puccinia triticina 1-1 BBBD Race 1]
MVPRLLFNDEDFNTQRHILYTCQTTQELLNKGNMDYLNSSDSKDKAQASTKMKITCQPNKDWGHLEHHKNLMNNYFNEDLRYGPQDFSHRYRMEKGLFLRILTDLTA